MIFEQITPIIYEANKQQAITISCYFSDKSSAEKTYNIYIQAVETHEKDKFEVCLKNNNLHFDYNFGKEQEYKVFVNNKEIFSIFCLDPDLYERNPYKGDFHIHSNSSDGLDDSAYVAAAARSIGMDFLAITDHGQYQPSIQAIEAFRNFETDFLLLPGEEVHPPNNPVHIINFGGTKSINTIFPTNEYPDFKAETFVSEMHHELDSNDNRLLKECEWCFDEIDKVGGISILCHPFWITDNNEYNIKSSLLERLIANKKFTALELLGGHSVQENNLQTAYFFQKQREGCTFPIVGVSDAHGTYKEDFFGWTYTIVFSKELSQSGIKESLINEFSVAIEHKAGEEFRVYGSFRLVKYALFLIKEYFPKHDLMCSKEGKLMHNFIKQTNKKLGEKLL